MLGGLMLLIVAVVPFVHTECICNTTGCLDGWTRFEDSCYALIRLRKTWANAQISCELLGGNLVTITKSRENTKVASMLAAAGVWDAWIGANDLMAEGHFRWIKTNHPLYYTNWNNTQPDDFEGEEDCGTIFDNGFWNDYVCTNYRVFVCEASPKI